LQTPPLIDSAASDFRFCMSMKHEPAVEYLSYWHRVAEEVGLGNLYCDEIVNFVSSGRGYTDEEKVDFQSRRAARFYRLAREERAISPTDAVAKLRLSGTLNCESYSRSIKRGYRNTLRYERHFR